LNNVRIQAQRCRKKRQDEEVLQGSPTFDIMIIVSLTYTLKNLPKIVAELEELKKQILNQKKGE
jgi:UDP-3-O-[3-hydroxymyristoyl] glucosamine N-acyltransferase